mmetsp:Transcript_6912/g.24585  ORF Transcript_6912/g.24585 Transcript_6912/m.24585 type:complete len:499 (-) Transcript_6912:1149-2645(-)
MRRVAWRRTAERVASVASDAACASWTELLDADGVVRDADALEAHSRDWSGRYVGRSRAVLQPRTTEEVQRVLRHCHVHRIPVVPQGGNTGLVGGGVPMCDEVVLSTTRMRRVLDVDANEGVAVVEAGCVLEDLDRVAKQHHHAVPVDLGAKRRCQVGGLVSTHAAGTRHVRYGPLRGSVLGVEAVLADGTVVSTLQKRKKNNAGIDLQQLFVGAEGTLGVVTKVALRLVPRANAVHVVFLHVHTYEAVVKTMMRAKEHLAEILSAAEYMDRSCLDASVERMDHLRHPFSNHQDERREEDEFYVLLETAGSRAEHDASKIRTFLDALARERLVRRSVVAQDEAQAKSYWMLREGIAEALGKIGHVLKYDVSLPLIDMNRLVERTREAVREHEDVQVFGFGHLGDGNVHLNVCVNNDRNKMEQVRKEIEDDIYAFVVSVGGSISAEHGIGQLKLPALPLVRDENYLRIAAKIKKMLDPHLILNPNKVLPPEYLEPVDPTP